MSHKGKESVALVLGGGGQAAIGWLIGLLHGFDQHGVSIHDFTHVVGTSAGASVAAQLATGIPPAELYSAITQAEPDPISESADEAQTAAVQRLFDTIRDKNMNYYPPESTRRVVEDLNAGAPWGDNAEERLREIEKRLQGRTEWPSTPEILMTTVRVSDGALRILSKDDNIPLTTAVAASCAVPGHFAPVEVNGDLLVDAAVRSGTNIDVAQNFDRVVLLLPAEHVIPRDQRQLTHTTLSVAVRPTNGCVTDLANPLNRGTAAPMARVGYQQAKRAVPLVKAVLSAAASEANKS